MAVIKEHDFGDGYLLDVMCMVYDYCSVNPLPAEWDWLPASIKSYMDAVYTGARQDYSVGRWTLDWPRMRLNPQGRRICVGFSGGKDSAATALWAMDAGYDVTLFHVRGLNKSYPNEFEHAARLAVMMGLPLVVRNARVTGRSDYMDNPVKNQLILAAMVTYGAAHGIGNYALGDFWDDTLEKSSLTCNLSDARELWLGIERFIGSVYSDFKYVHIFSSYTESYMQILKTRPELLEHVMGCVAPLRFRAGYRAANIEKYGPVLLPGRCGSCWKCCAEFLVLYKLYNGQLAGDIEYAGLTLGGMCYLTATGQFVGIYHADDFYNKCIKYLRGVMPREKPFITEPGQLSDEEVARLFAPAPKVHLIGKNGGHAAGTR